MSTRKKLFLFLDALGKAPHLQEQAVDRVAALLAVSARAVKRAIKVTKAEQIAGQEIELPDVEQAAADLVFDGTNYWRRELDGNFGKLGREDTLLQLRKLGFSAKKPSGVEVSAAEEALHHIQTANRVVYAAPFCGRAAGRYVENGLAILATDSPRIVKAALGDPLPLVDFFADLFGRSANEPHWSQQYQTFLAWLQRARAALTNPDQHLPGQLVAFVGPADCGKTLAQTLITLLLGGRQADPGQWLTGASAFNDGIWGAEHWAASDSNIEDTLSARKMLRDRVKEATANERLSCHRKHRGEITLRPIARLTISANDDADSTFVLPVLDDSIRDKVIYLKCHRPAVPFHGQAEADRAAFFKKLTAALPAFLHVVESFVVPAALRKGRFGVREFHHPALVRLLVGANPDNDLGDIISDWLDKHDQPTWSGGATQLYDILHLQGATGAAFQRVCPSPTRLGQALGRLSRADGWRGRVTSLPIRKGPNRQEQLVWTLRRPSEAEAQPEGG